MTIVRTTNKSAGEAIYWNHDGDRAVALLRLATDNGAMSTADPSPKTKRRWHRFSLLTLLIVVTLSCVGFAWVGLRMQRARVNRDRVAAVKHAVVEIEKLGGKVISTPKVRRPQTWLERQFDDPGDADDPVSVLKVTVVQFFNKQVTDDWMEHLEGLPHLKSLNLLGSNVTDAGLVYLKGLTELEELDLSNTKISDAGLEHLKGLTNLRLVALRETKVTDAGLEHLRGLSNLQELFLGGTQITDVGLEHLKGLATLDLSKTKVTDAGLEHLERLTNLHVLFLWDTDTTDAGLEHLKGLKSLQWLNISGTNVTDEGVKKLQQALPNCRIHH